MLALAVATLTSSYAATPASPVQPEETAAVEHARTNGDAPAPAAAVAVAHATVTTASPTRSPAGSDPALAAPGESFPDLTRDGAWCWFSDPRALEHNGTLYATWVSSDGSVVVGARPPGDRTGNDHVLHPQFERDDHDVPALLLLPDGRLSAFYSLHAQGHMRLRTTTKPEGIGEWSTERSLEFGSATSGRRGTTYANPVLLSDEANTLFLFWRGADFKPTFARSLDLGATWSGPETLIARPGADDTNRPYVKVCTDGKVRIDFAFTDGHPRNEPTNSLYYVRYERGEFQRADSTRLGDRDDLPLDPSRCDLVYDGRTQGRAWVWDIATDARGRATIAFAQMPTETDHRYAIASWDGARWQTRTLTAAGRWFPQTPAGENEREPHYSGGMAINPANPHEVFTSRQVNGVFEIERWDSADGGVTWRSTTVTAGSHRDNVRPFVVRSSATRDTVTVLWMNVDRYVHYTDYRCAIKRATLANRANP